MAQNKPQIIEVPTPQSRQVKRKGSDADLHGKRLRTDDNMEIEIVPKEEDEKYATKEDFNICMERISKIESRLAKIEKTFESLKSAFLGSNHPSKSLPSSASSAPGPIPSASTSSNSSSTSFAMLSSAMNSSKETPPSVALSTQVTNNSSAMSAQRTPLSSAAKSAQRTPLSSAARSIQGTPNSSISKSAQVTPVSSASKPPQVIPVSSGGKSAQVTLVSSASKPPQVIPVSSGGKSAQVTPVSSVSKPAQVTSLSSASKSAQGTPVCSGGKSAQVTPVSSGGKSAQVTPVSSASKPAQVTPVYSGGKSAQVTPVSSASKPPQVTSLSSASKSAQVTPVSSASNSAQVTPISSGGKSSQVTPISFGGKSAQVSPISSAGKPAQVTVTPISSASKSTQGTTPPSGTKSAQGTSTSARKSSVETVPLGKKSTQGISSLGAKFAQAPSIGVSKPVQAPAATKSAQSVPSSAESSPASNLRRRPVVNSVQESHTSAVKRKSKEAIDDDVTVIPTDDSEITTVSTCSTVGIQIFLGSSAGGKTSDNSSDKNANEQHQPNSGLIDSNAGVNKPRINVIPQSELLAVHSDHPTCSRNLHSQNQQRAGPLLASNTASHPRPQQITSTSSSSTSVRAQTSSYEAAQTNMDESWAGPSASDMTDMPEEVFCYIRPKQEIYENLENRTIETPTNKQLVAYIDGDCRKKKNHDIYAAVAGYSLSVGTKIYSVSYVSDLKNPFMRNMTAVKANRKMVELVKQQTEVMAAYLVMAQIKNLGASCNDRLKVVSRCQRLVQIMKGSLDVYPAFNICQCNHFPCNHPQRWETLDNFAHLLLDDLPRLILATKSIGIDVEWCNYTPFDQEEIKISESFKKEFKKKISELLSRTNRRNTMPV